MNTFVIPNSACAAFINVNNRAVRLRFEKDTGCKVLFAGFGETKQGYRCVVVLEGVYTDTKVLEALSNYPFANTAWWYEEGLPVEERYEVSNV